MALNKDGLEIGSLATPAQVAKVKSKWRKDAIAKEAKELKEKAKAKALKAKEEADKK
jgi:methionine synthase II (cobalamin-independent)